MSVMPFRQVSRKFRRRLCLLLVSSISFQAVSCGTILYPERQGQLGGRLDPAIVVLDGIGLLLFIVPGAIAFAVDFYNGTIYLPYDEYRMQSPDELESANWRAVTVDREINSREELEAYLFKKTGREVQLDPNTTRVSSVKTLPDAERVQKRPFASAKERLGSWSRFLPVLPFSHSRQAQDNH
jgi:hypothetical protein